MAHFDRFDIAEAYWCYFIEWHGGQNSVEYRRLSKMDSYFKPRHNLSSDTLEENSREIYTGIVMKYHGLRAAKRMGLR
jgi:hypothetical protein